MDEPEFRTSRIAIALGFLAAVAVGGGGFLLGRTTAPRPVPVEAAPPPQTVLPPTPAESPLLGRADFLALAAKAADAFAAGTPLPADVAGAAGRRFDLVMPLGCAPTPAEQPGKTSWSDDAARGRLRITIPPAVWSGADWAPGTEGIESVEGFWIARPWTNSTACPPPLPPLIPAAPAAPESEGGAPPAKQPPASPEATSDTPVTPAAQTDETVAVAQFFTASGSSGIRRAGRPYSIVSRIPPDKFDASRGFRLRLTGRIDKVPGGGPVQCVQPRGRNTAPACVIATVLDEVRVENPATGTILATWSATHSTR